MEHQGKRLRGLAKGQGFDIQSLADKLEVTRITVENDFRAEKLSRRILKKYVPVLGLDLDGFYKEGAQTVVANESSKIEKLQAEIIYWQRKYIDLQERFFPSAAQLA